MRFQPPPSVIAAVMANLRPNRVTDKDGQVRKIGRSLRRGEAERRVIAQTKIDGVEYAYHATKGWRRRPIDLVVR